MLTGFIDEMEQIGWSCSYRRNGSLKLALNEPELEQIMQSAKLLNEDGREVQTVSRNDLTLRLRNTYLGGTYYPANAEFHPARFITGLAGLALQAGAMFHCQSKVKRLQRHPVSPARHRKAQEAALSQACAYHGKRKERQKQCSASEFIYAKLKQAEVIWAACEETPDGRALLRSFKSEKRQSYRKRNEQIDAEADSRHTWA